MQTGNAALDPVNVQAALGQFDLLPLQVADLRRPQAVAIGDQDHGRVAMSMAAVLARAVHQPLDLALGEIASLDCQVYDAWCGFFGCRFHADKLCLCVSYCTRYTHLLHSQIETLRPTGSARALSLRRAAAMTAGRATTGGFIGPTPAFQRGQAHQ